MTLPNTQPLNENTRIVMRHWTLAQPVVSAFIGSLVRDFTDRDDVLQETAVALLESADRYDANRPFVAWALGIARNQVRLYLRRTGRDRCVFDESLIDELSTAFTAVSSQEIHRLSFLRDCLQRLDAREQLLVQLRYAEDLKPAVIGERLGLAANTVSKALQRLRDQLRVCIERAAALEGGLS
jgi:RNA polymerase sigma-70 factor (ECF subfamily)